jgi:N utilization substance protein B
MSSPRRQAREIVLKTLYQNEMIQDDFKVTLYQVIRESILIPALENIVREFIKNSSNLNQILSGEVEEFLPDFSREISASLLDNNEDISSQIKSVLENYFSGITTDEKAEKAISSLTRKVLNKQKKLSPAIKFATELIDCYSENKNKVNRILEETAQNWSLERMSCIDRCILRFATCELIFFESIPIKASINEAIELAKQYSADRSFEFVNGILDRIRKENTLVKHGTTSNHCNNDKTKKRIQDAPAT